MYHWYNCKLVEPSRGQFDNSISRNLSCGSSYSLVQLYMLSDAHYSIVYDSRKVLKITFCGLFSLSKDSLWT